MKLSSTPGPIEIGGDLALNGSSQVFSPGVLSGLWSWYDLSKADTYTLSGSDITSLRGRAGLYASSALGVDDNGGIGTDGGVVAQIADSGAGLLNGAPSILIGANTNMWTSSGPALSSGPWSVSVLVEGITFPGGVRYGGIVWFGRRYFVATAHAYGGLGQSGGAGAMWGGGVSQPGGTFHGFPLSNTALSTVAPQVWTVEHGVDGTTRMYVNGVEDSSFAIARGMTDAGIGIGRNGGYTPPDARLWSPVYIGGRVLTTTERTRLVRWYLNRHKVAYVHAVGDSITSGGIVISADQAWAAVAQTKIRANQKAYRLNNQAVSGRTSATMLANFSTEILAKLDTSYCVNFVEIDAGSNDLGAGTAQSLSDLQSNVSSMVAQAIAANAIPIVCTVLDRTDYGSAARTNLGTFNTWLRNGGAGTTRLNDFRKLQETGSVTVGGVTITGSVTLPDGIHPDATSQDYMAQIATANTSSFY